LASTATFGGGAGDAITFTVDTTDFSVDLSTAKTLAEIRDEINGSGNTTGITANVISGDGGLQSLVLTAADSGYDQRIQQSYGGSIGAGTFGLDTINTDSGGAPLAADTELDASLTVDGISVTRGGNSIDDVVSGVTLNIVAEGSTTISVAQNDSGVVSAVSTAVSAFNAALSAVGGSAQQTSGASRGLLRGIETQLRNVLNASVKGLSSNYSTLTEMGITTLASGQLSFDSSVLTDALQTDRTGVKALFTDTATGFAVNFDNVLSGMTKSGGVLDSLVEGLNTQIGNLATRRVGLQNRLDQTETRLRAQFTALDQLVASLTTTSNYLTTQLSSLSSILTRNSN
jgi:flagellar hook-associated protein 2